MEEQIYNFFLIADKGFLHTIGLYIHTISGTDAEKYQYLQSKVAEDLPNCKKYPLDKSIKSVINGKEIEGVISIETANTHGGFMLNKLFEKIYVEVNASNSPLYVST